VRDKQFPSAFYALIGAQFFSGLADNALLLVCIGMLMTQGTHVWWIPLLKVFFTFSYVLLAPWVGALADRWSKPKVMRLAHVIKFAGCALIIGDVPIPFAYACVGLGAAIYAPAKYGWITETVSADRLVQANSWIEVSTVGAAIFGVVLGGTLLHVQPVHALSLILLIYTLNWWSIRWVTCADKMDRQQTLHWKEAVWQFKADLTALWTDPLGRVSMSVTTIFWGLGAVMQLLVLRWAQSHLGLSLDHGAYLQGVAGFGVVLGAWWAGHKIPLTQAVSVLALGVFLGMAMPVMNWIHSEWLGIVMMLWVGAVSGILVVPMNALLQHQGLQLLSAGRSIAVQNFNENLGVLVFNVVYATLVFQQWPLSDVLWFLGVVVAVSMALIGWRHRRSPTTI
jgi:LPLT family lysophospholipid transporter-like MFS transporter